jgi:hypothetical protein
VANRMTALALSAINRYGGPRCCKRVAITALNIANENFGCFPEDVESRYICSQFVYNDMCLRYTCPYYPEKRTGESICI